MSYKRKYYTQGFGRCIMRTSDVKGTEILLPERPEEKLPLSIQVITQPSKEAFDDLIKSMKEEDEDMFNCYMMHFIGRVDVDIKAPMSEKQIKMELNKQTNFSTYKTK